VRGPLSFGSAHLALKCPRFLADRVLCFFPRSRSWCAALVLTSYDYGFRFPQAPGDWKKPIFRALIFIVVSPLATDCVPVYSIPQTISPFHESIFSFVSSIRSKRLSPPAQLSSVSFLPRSVRAALMSFCVLWFTSSYRWICPFSSGRAL